jgi:nicotinamidase-related amidase
MIQSKNPLILAAQTTALVVIDLQQVNTTRQLAPHHTITVIENSVKLAKALRKKGGTIVFVRVDLAQLLHLSSDGSFRGADAPPPPASASALVSELNIQEGDFIVTKRQWGAFYGTDLDQILRRKGIRTLVMAGVATNFGVESTARAAFDRGYELVFAEDAMSSVTADAHSFAVKDIFPRMGHVRNTTDVSTAFG